MNNIRIRCARAFSVFLLSEAKKFSKIATTKRARALTSLSLSLSISKKYAADTNLCPKHHLHGSFPVHAVPVAVGHDGKNLARVARRTERAFGIPDGHREDFVSTLREFSVRGGTEEEKHEEEEQELQRYHDDGW